MANCSAKVWSSPAWGANLCSRKGSIERDGKWYCKQHDPVARGERHEKATQERWQRLANAQQVDKANQHKLATYDELLEALEGLDRAFVSRHGCFPIDRSTSKAILWNDAMSNARLAIKRAKQ